MNKLFYGDNLDILKDFANHSVDLIYLDPPFNSNANYNILFKENAGQESEAQIEAFKDTWHWNEEAALNYDLAMRGSNSKVSSLLKSFHGFIGENDILAYLAMMACRLLELHRVLKDTGSLYLHCDPTASHYLKLLLDATFGIRNYRNEITWKRTHAHSDGKKWGRNTDIIFYYTKTDDYTWNQQYLPYDIEYIKRFRNKDADGRLWMDDNLTAKGLTGGGYSYEYKGAHSLWRMPRVTMEKLDKENRLHFTNTGGIRLKRYLDEAKGFPAQALFDDINPLNAQSKERLGYPTQKPVALLERLILASSNENDVILDPFCGCGTAVHASEKLKRKWIGIDITHLAVGLIEKRMKEAFKGIKFEIIGVPQDYESAKALAIKDKYEFQKWITIFIGGQLYKSGKKGKDGGIDGYLHFKDEKRKPQAAIISVKGGESLTPSMVRDLKGVITRDNSPIGIFLCLNKPTKDMEKEALSAGFYHVQGINYPRIQILTVEQLFNGSRPRIPFGYSTSLFEAQSEMSEKQEILI